jgi:hypothetical protein
VCCSSRVVEGRCVFLSRFFGGVLLPAEPLSCALAVACVSAVWSGTRVYPKRGSRLPSRAPRNSGDLYFPLFFDRSLVQECDFSMSHSLFRGQQEQAQHADRCKSKKKRTITPPYRPWRKSSSTMKPVCSSETQIRIL